MQAGSALHKSQIMEAPASTWPFWQRLPDSYRWIEVMGGLTLSQEKTDIALCFSQGDMDQKSTSRLKSKRQLLVWAVELPKHCHGSKRSKAASNLPLQSPEQCKLTKCGGDAWPNLLNHNLILVALSIHNIYAPARTRLPCTALIYGTQADRSRLVIPSTHKANTRFCLRNRSKRLGDASQETCH